MRNLGLGLAALLAAGLCSTSRVQAAGKAAKDPSDWKILGAAGEVKSGTKYTLRNVTENESLRHGKRLAGINLVWDKKTTLANVSFTREGGAAALNYGDKVALHVSGGGHLYYKKRTIGMNLVWSTPPKYEWVILGGEKGKPVTTDTALALYNERAKDFLIYGERPRGTGINLRWWADRDFGGSWSARIKRATDDLKKKYGVPAIAAEYAARLALPVPLKK